MQFRISRTPMPLPLGCSSAWATAFVLVILLCLSALPVWAQFGPEPRDSSADSRLADRTAAEARTAYEQNLARYKGNPDMLVLPGLLADRRQKWVRIWGRATSVAHSDPIEFWVIPVDSGKDYEALSVAYAKPSDVHRALEFIGMKAGRPVDFHANQFWPKGERVIMTFAWDEPPAEPGSGNKPSPQRLRAEELIVDTEAKKPLPAEGLVFVGSYWITPEEGGKRFYAGDVHDSKAIASDYNNRSTVLDIPRQAPQGAVYGTLKMNPAHRFAPGQPVQITLEPEHKDGKTRVIDLSLQVSLPAGHGAPQAARYMLADQSGGSVAEGETLIHLLAAFGKLIEAGKDPFVTVQVDDAMTLESVRQIYALLMTMDTANGIRIDGPPQGQLYYRAFFPRDEWRDRNRRLGRPWELHLVEKDRKVAGTLILPADDIDDNNGAGDLKFTVGSPEELARILAEKSGKFSQTVYIYAPGSVKYGALMSFIRPGMRTHDAMYVFLP